MGRKEGRDGHFRVGGGRSYFIRDYIVIVSGVCFWGLLVQRLKMSLISVIGKDAPR